MAPVQRVIAANFVMSFYVDVLQVNVDPIKVGRIRKIRVQHDGDNDEPGWHLDKVNEFALLGLTTFWNLF